MRILSIWWYNILSVHPRVTSLRDNEVARYTHLPTPWRPQFASARFFDKQLHRSYTRCCACKTKSIVWHLPQGTVPRFDSSNQAGFVIPFYMVCPPSWNGGRWVERRAPYTLPACLHFCYQLQVGVVRTAVTWIAVTCARRITVDGLTTVGTFTRHRNFLSLDACNSIIQQFIEV